MASNATNLFGWDLLFASVDRDVKNHQDVLVCFTHLVLISNGFRCVGIGDSKTLDGTETKSETLPRGWNDNYAIRYVHQGKLYNLRGTSLDDGVMINLIRVDERSVSMVQLNTRAVVQRTGTLTQMIPDNVMLAQTIKDKLINKVVVSTKHRETATQTPPQPQAPPQRDPAYNPLLVDPSGNSLPFFPRTDPVGVGRADLDPFGGAFIGPVGPMPGVIPPGGGGMLFQPPQGPRFDPGPNLGVPRGSVPPGARFDPFRPPGGSFPRRPHNPDSDEMPPPGFDDMYM